MRLAAVGNKKQAILLVVLAVVLVLAVVRWRPGGKSSAAPNSGAATARAGDRTAALGDEAAPPRPSGRVRTPKEISADEIPILQEKDFAPPSNRASLDTGRDLFGIPREPTHRPLPTPLPPPPPPGDTRFIGPLPPPPPTPTPRPPEITFKFVGTFGPKGHPIAVIQQGDKVYNVRAGDVLFDKFVLRSVGYESLEISFVGFPETANTRIGITPN